MKLRSALAGVMDQVWLSVISLVISFFFIKFSSKEDYGIYLLLMSPLFFLQGLQNALINSPAASILPVASAGEKENIIKTVVSMHIVLIAIAAVLGFVGLFVYFLFFQPVIDILLCTAFGVLVMGTLAREAGRTFFYAQMNPERAFLGDIVYGISLIVLMAILINLNNSSVVCLLFAIGLSALWPYFIQAVSGVKINLDIRVLHDFWKCGRWALIGVLVTWVNLSAYPLIVAKLLGITAVADINAARIFTMPIGIAITGWSNIVRPRVCSMLANNNHGKVKYISMLSVAIGLFAIAIFAVALYLSYPLIEPLLGEKYSGLIALVLLWLLYFSVNLVRSVFMASLMVDEQGYKSLQTISWIALVFSLGGMFLFASIGAAWVIGVLILVEIVQLTMMLPKVNSRWKIIA